MQKYPSYILDSSLLKPAPFIASGLHLPVSFGNVPDDIRHALKVTVKRISLKCHLVHIIPGYDPTAVCRNVIMKSRHPHHFSRMYPVVRLPRNICHIFRHAETIALRQCIIIWEQMTELCLICRGCIRTIFHLNKTDLLRQGKVSCKFHDLFIRYNTPVVYPVSLFFIRPWTYHTEIIHQLCLSGDKIIRCHHCQLSHIGNQHIFVVKV